MQQQCSTTKPSRCTRSARKPKHTECLPRYSRLIVGRTSSSIVSPPSERSPRASAYLILVDDELFRDRGRAKTMSYSMLQRTEGLRTRSVRSTWYYWLVGWVDKIKGGPGYIGPPPTSAGSSTPQVQKKPGNGPE